MPTLKTAPKYLVYGLVDPRTLSVEYVGKSSSGVKRARAHRRPSSFRRSDSAKNVWLRELFAAGHDYEIVILGSVEDPKAPGTLCWWWTGKNATTLNDLERWWIAYGRSSGWTLKNGTSGGEGAAGRVTSDELRAARSTWVKAYCSRPEVKIAQRVRGAELFNRPDVRALTNAGKNRPEVLTALSEWSKEYSDRPDVKATRSVRAKEFLNRPDIRAVTLAATRARRTNHCGTVSGYTMALRRKRAGDEHCGPCAACQQAGRDYRTDRNRDLGKAVLGSLEHQNKLRAAWTPERRAAQSARTNVMNNAKTKKRPET